MTGETLTHEERIFGLFSHLSLFFGGIILPFIIWLIYKDKSKYVAFNALQSLLFHICFAILITILAFSFIITGYGLSLLSFKIFVGFGKGVALLVIILTIIIFILFILLAFFMMAYSLFMGIRTYHGELVKYPFIGNIIYKKIYS